ncbi:hypothetical protein Tco_0737049 [Tanacetum coccineum]
MDIPDKMCDVPFCDNSTPLDISKDQFEGFFNSNDDSTSIDDDSFSIDDIDYVEASPPDSELVSLEEVKDYVSRYGELTSIVNSRIRENVLSTTNVNLPFEDDQSPLFAYVDCPDFEASRARGFVLRSLELQILSFIWESNILILSTNVYLLAYLINGFRVT